MPVRTLTVETGATVDRPLEGEPTEHWYAAYTYPRHEKRVLSQLETLEIEAFLPTYKAVHRWRNGVKATLDLALFPSYVFVRIDLRNQLSVLKVPSIITLVGFGGCPAPLPDGEIEVLKNGLGKVACEPHPFLETGQRVRIKSGPLAGLSGILLARRAHGFRLVVNVDLLRQACAVEVDAADLDAM